MTVPDLSLPGSYVSCAQSAILPRSVLPCAKIRTWHLPSPTTSTASARKPKEVELRIVGNNLVMDTNSGDNDCESSSSREKGCIRLKKNEKSEIYFHLKGDTRCDDLESGTVWKLNAVYLGGFDSSSKPPKNGYGFANTAPANFDKVNKDFEGVNKASGLVTPVDKSDKKITIKDNNQYKYDVWYKIVALCEREDGGEAWHTSYDPRVKNDGTD
jgi:hypothetical protein